MSIIEIKLGGDITRIKRSKTDGVGGYEIDGTAVFTDLITAIDYYGNGSDTFTMDIHLSTGVEYNVDCSNPGQIIKMIKRNEIIPKLLNDEKQ
jgi:hypothetical protein